MAYSRLIERTDRTAYKVLKVYPLYGETCYLVESPSLNRFDVLESSVASGGYFDLLESQEWIDAVGLAHEYDRAVDIKVDRAVRGLQYMNWTYSDHWPTPPSEEERIELNLRECDVWRGVRPHAIVYESTDGEILLRWTARPHHCRRIEASIFYIDGLVTVVYH